MWAAAENHAGRRRRCCSRAAPTSTRARTLLEVPRRRSGQSVLPLGELDAADVRGARRTRSTRRVRSSTRGADLNADDPDGATALVIAIINAQLRRRAQVLLEKGADPNIADNEAAWRALYAAVDMHRLAIGHGRPNPRPSGELDGARHRQACCSTHGADPNARLKAADRCSGSTPPATASLGEGATPLHARRQVRRHRGRCGCCSRPAPIRS